MRTKDPLLLSLSLCAVFASVVSARADSPNVNRQVAIEHFEKHVRPLLVEKCITCHGPTKQRGGLRLDSRAAILKGGDSGPSLIVGQPDKSLLVKVVLYTGDLKMPPKDKDRLDAQAIGHLRQWIQTGAHWPEGDKPAVVNSMDQARKEHYAFRPVVKPTVPVVKDSSSTRTPIDRFIVSRLESKNLKLSNCADRRTLFRRLSFDLTGLPPQPEAMEAFVHDTRPGAYERLVEQLLASPAYGERWGRHWLDVARYADTKGYVFQEERRYPFSYTYRDYVIEALNQDLPYDQFIIQQLAADQLPLGDDRKPLAAMGFLTLGRRFLNNTHDIIDDRIDVVSRGLMGLTVGCARCHDHKFDPVPSRDYYSLYGIFAGSVEPKELPLLQKPDPTAEPTAFEKELRVRQAKVDAFLQGEREKTLTRLRSRAGDYLIAAASNAPPSREYQAQILQRWKMVVNRVNQRHHPELTPLVQFVRLGKDDFAPKAKTLIERLRSGKEPGKPINPLILKAFEGETPKALAEVGKRYQKVFDDVEKAWQEAVSTAKKQGKPVPTQLADANQEKIRQLLHGDRSPTNVPQAELERVFDRAQRNRLRALQKQVDGWRATGPGSKPRAMVLNDTPAPFNPVVFVRGNPGNRGVAVPRQFLEILSPERKPFKKGSGRLELAQSIADPKNPLTARVMVNRVWMHHFGVGIVRTPGDFGTRGEPPTHPELLDWLADEFVASNWSIKHLHRLILLSAVYQQKSEDRESAAAIDPENTLFWRMNRRRLEFEPLRDALLATSGTLDRRMTGPAVDITKAPYPPRRSVYAFIERQNLPGVFRTFDLASPDVSTPQRHATTVPQQSLFLMNSPFLRELAKNFANREDVRSAPNDEVRIDRMVRLAFGRPADGDEIQMALAFLKEDETGKASSLTPLEQYAQVLLLANEFAFVD